MPFGERDRNILVNQPTRFGTTTEEVPKSESQRCAFGSSLLSHPIELESSANLAAILSSQWPIQVNILPALSLSLWQESTLELHS